MPGSRGRTSGAAGAGGRGRLSAGRVVVVLPAYNEESSIGELVDATLEVLAGAGFEHLVLVVDDGSADDTAAIVADRAARTGAVHLIRNETNLGLGGAVARGLERARALCRAGDVIVTMDADLTHDPAYIPSLVEAHGRGADVVVASRFRPGSAVVGVPGYRRLFSLGVRAVAAVFAPIPGVRDYSCGYRLYDARVLGAAMAEVGPGLITERGFGYAFEILLGLRPYARFAEVPFVLRYDAKRRRSALRILPTIGSYAGILARQRRSGPGRRAGRGRARPRGRS